MADYTALDFQQAVAKWGGHLFGSAFMTIVEDTLMVCNLDEHGAPIADSVIAAYDVENWEGTPWETKTVTWDMIDKYSEQLEIMLHLAIGE